METDPLQEGRITENLLGKKDLDQRNREDREFSMVRYGSLYAIPFVICVRVNKRPITNFLDFLHS